MAILISQRTNTGNYSLSSSDANNKFYGLSNIAETVDFSGTGNFNFADVSNGDILNLTSIIPTSSNAVNISVSGNNVVLTSGTGTSLKTYTLGALIAGESVTVNFGSNKQSISITATDTTVGTVTTTNYTYALNGATPVGLTTTATAIGFDTESTTPIINAVATDNIVNNSEKTTGVAISGTADAGATVAIIWGGKTQTATATGGNWTTTFSAADVPADGSTTISVVATDLAGNVSTTVTKSVVVDTATPIITAPTAPTILAITSSALTNDTTPDVTGTAEAGSEVTVVIAGATYKVTATDDGTWSVDTTSTAVTNGTLAIAPNDTNSISVTATDTAGNISSAVTQSLMVDTTAPTVTVTLADAALKIGETSLVTFTFSEAVTDFNLTDDVVAANGTFGTLSSATNNVDGTQTYTALFTPTASFESAANVITVTKTGVLDAANNAGVSTTSSANYTIDTLAPTAPTGISLSAVGGTTVANTLNGTNTNIVAAATIVAGETTGGSAILKVNGVTVATDIEILVGDSTVDFAATVDSTFKSQVSVGGAITVDLIDAAGNIKTSIVNPMLTVDYVAPTAPLAPTVTVTGGTVVANTLNNSNTNLTASATITQGEATGGKASLKLGTTTIATDSTILSGDTTVDFDLGKTTTSALQTAIAAGDNLTVELEDAAGNTVMGATQTLTVDYVESGLTVSGLALSADTGTAADFKTNTAAQTITATLSGALTASDTVWGSVNNGANWFDITPTSGTAISWTTNATLVGSNTIKMKIVDAAGNAKEVASQAYVLDETLPVAPTFALESDTGSSGSDLVTSNAKIIVSGIEADATWEYSTDSGTNWAAGTGTNFSLPLPNLPAAQTATFAADSIQVKQTDSVGNVSIVNTTTNAGTNATQIILDKASPTAQTVTAAQAFKGNASFATGLTLTANEKIWLAPSATSIFTANASTITSSVSATISTPTTEGNYALFLEDAAGNISPASSNTIAIDDTAPTSTITDVAYIQKSGVINNVIRLTGMNFDTIGNADLTAQLDLTKLVWNVGTNNQQVITATDIQSITKVSDTQIDIVLNANNALYNNPDFLTGSASGAGVIDTLAITEGFIKDKAGNAATTDELWTENVDTTTAYAMTLTGGVTVDAPTVYVPNIVLTAPSTGTAAAFSGLYLKAVPTVLLSIEGIATGQTITVTNLLKMDYVTAPNTISFKSTATTASTEKVVIDLTGAKALNFNNPYNVKTDITFVGGGAYMQLGSGVDYIELKTLAPAAGVGNLSLDYVEKFATGSDRVNLNQAMLTGLSGTTSADFTSDVVTDVPDADGNITSATVTFTGVSNGNKSNLAVTGTNSSTVTIGSVIEGTGSSLESAVVTFTALTNDQTFTLNGITVTAPSIGLTAHEVATLFASQQVSTAATINQVSVSDAGVAGKNIWISNIDGTISYDVDGDWNAGGIQLISVVTPSLGNIADSDLYLV
jgi:hypothetical protein